MKEKIYTLILILLVTINLSANTPLTDSSNIHQYGIGLQAAPFPIFGLSFNYRINKSISLNAFGRLGIDVDFLALRAKYSFKFTRNYNIYVSGLAGIFRDNNVSKSIFSKEESDTAPGFGAGIGFEYFFDSLPEFGFNSEVDFVYIGFKKDWWQYDYKSPTLIMLGIGVHYYF
ncbi:MAG: hypothetical protein WC209_14465 [Ignavibacteriaceae bacterium]|jgi:hypothetical protein